MAAHFFIKCKTCRQGGCYHFFLVQLRKWFDMYACTFEQINSPNITCYFYCTFLWVSIPFLQFSCWPLLYYFLYIEQISFVWCTSLLHHCCHQDVCDGCSPQCGWWKINAGTVRCKYVGNVVLSMFAWSRLIKCFRPEMCWLCVPEAV